MTKKFFSLIHGDAVHIKPEGKVIPAEALSALLEALELIETAKQDVEKYKAEVEEECKKLKEEATKKGYEEGYQKWIDEISKLETEISNVRGDMEKVLIPVALKAAKKIVGREMELSENTIVDIVSTALKAVSQHKRITIYVNKKDLDPLEKGRERLKGIFESLEVLSVRERNDIAPGGCVIETEGGIINARLENQWNALEKAFSALIKPPEKKKSFLQKKNLSLKIRVNPRNETI